MLLTTIFSSNGQTVINKDSAIVPIRWLREGMKDLVRYDNLKKENILLKESKRSLEDIIETQNILITDFKTQKKEYEVRIKEIQGITLLSEKQYEAELNSLNKRLRNKKIGGTIKGIGAGVVGVGIGILIKALIIK